MKEIKRGVLSELPKDDKDRIIWKDTIGKTYDIMYNGEIHRLNIIDIDNSYVTSVGSKNRMFVRVDNLPRIHTIYKNGIVEGKFGAILNKHFKDYRYNIGDIIEQSNGCNFKILERTYTNRKKNGIDNNNIKSYTVECIDCSNILYDVSENMLSSNIRTVSCRKCADGISYGEKFVFNLLSQLVLDFEPQKKFHWSDNKFYDFYVEHNGLKIIIEVDGSQHMTQTTYGDLCDVKSNDKRKQDMAMQNGINHFIRIDAFYSNFEYIKQNILESNIECLFDLCNVNWTECGLNAVRKEFILLCKYWDNVKHLKYDMAIDILSKKFYYSKSTIPNLLRQGAKIGICDYAPIKEVRAVNNTRTTPVKVIVNNTIVKYFLSVSSCVKFLNKEYGENLNNGNIQKKFKSNRDIITIKNQYKITRITWDEYNQNIK